MCGLASAACSSADPLQTWLQLCLRSKQQSSHKCKKTQIARVKYCVRKYCSTFTQILLCTHRKRKAFIIQQRTTINIICLRFGEFSQYYVRWHWDLHCCLSVQQHCTRYIVQYTVPVNWCSRRANAKQTEVFFVSRKCSPVQWDAVFADSIRTKTLEINYITVLQGKEKGEINFREHFLSSKETM